MEATFNRLKFKIMKKIYSIAAALFALFSFAGCQQEFEQYQSLTESGNIVFTATLDASDTKMLLDYEKKLSVWSGEEYISVLNGTQNLTFKADVPTPSETAKFSCMMEEPVDLSEVVAMYPCRDYTLDKENMTVSGVYVPSSQSSPAGTYCVGAAVSMAYTTDKDLRFKNAVALIRFSVTEQGIWAVKLTANGGETLCGLHSLAWNDGNPAFILSEPQEDESGYDSITFWPTDGANFKVGEYYYMAVIPGEYSGFTVLMNNVEAHVIDETRTLERNKIYNLSDLALPAAESWGVCGTMTSWGDNDTPDLTPTKEDDEWWIYEGVTIGMSDRFQFRADNQWGRQLGYGGLVRSETETEFASDRADIHAYEPGIYDIYLAKDLTAFKIVKTGDPEGLPAEQAWGVCGSMTEWGAGGQLDFPMAVEGNLYVAENITIYTTDAFKFRVNNLWDYDLGVVTGTVTIPGMPYVALVSGENITVSQSGIYDVHLSRSEDAFRLVLKESLPDPEPEPEPEPENPGTGEGTSVYFKPSSVWMGDGITYHAWIWPTDGNGSWYAMSDPDGDGIYEVVVPEGMDMIIFASMNGAADWNNKEKQTADLNVPVDSKDTYVAYTNTWETLSDARNIDESTPVEVSWYLVGDFNGWGAGDANYKMEFDGTWYIFRNFASEGNLLKFNAGSWDVNRGGNFAEGGFVIVQDGADISVPAGTYDIYMNAATDKAYFCAPGTQPAI